MSNGIANQPKMMGRIAELDALRGIAAVCVMLYHFTHFLPILFPQAGSLGWTFSWGCYGVQAFFAVSGFVILMTLDSTKSAGDFIVSRFSRLFPAYWAAIAVTLFIIGWFGPAKLHVDGTTILANLTMLQTYFGALGVDGAYWSLAVELAFYVIMLGIWRLRMLDRIEVIVSLWIAVRWLGLLLPGWAEGLNLFLIADHIPYFVVGLLAYRIWSGKRTLIQQMPVFALAYLSVYKYDPSEPTVAFLFVCALMLLLATGKLGGLRHPILLWIGTISYPLYLVHQNAGYTLILHLRAAGVGLGAATILAIVQAFVLATLIHAIVEKPALSWIRNRWRNYSRNKTAPAMELQTAI